MIIQKLIIKKMTVFIILLFLGIHAFSQQDSNYVAMMSMGLPKTDSIVVYKTKLPIWYMPSNNVRIEGIAVGPFTNFEKESYMIVDGLRIELIGLGILLALIPEHPFLTNDGEDNGWYVDSLVHYSSVCNGMAISALGNVSGYEKVNGIQLSGVGSHSGKVNGISCALLFFNMTRIINGFSFGGLWNSSIKVNGMQTAILFNESVEICGTQLGTYNSVKTLHGVQLGLINKAKATKGIQIGLWNKNEKRSLPILNWNFK